MVTPGLRALFQGQGIPLIPLEEGARMLADELRGGDSAVEVMIGGAPPSERPEVTSAPQAPQVFSVAPAQ
jgi:hypothetical protein